MSQTVHRMTTSQFIDWQQYQDELFELVDGRPVAMTGARVVPDRVVGNVTFALKSQLRAQNSPCDTFSDDIAIRIDHATIRRPDLSIHCPPIDDDASVLAHPRLVAEVLSRSTMHVDQFAKLAEYQSLFSMEYILLIHPGHIEIGAWSRDVAGAWQREIFRDGEDVVRFPRLGLTLSVSDAYARVIDNPATL